MSFVFFGQLHLISPISQFRRDEFDTICYTKSET